MAVIDGNVPSADEHRPRQIVIKLEGRDGPQLMGKAMSFLKELIPGAEPRPMLRGEERLSEAASGVLGQYLTIALPEGIDGEQVVRRLIELPQIADAYVGGSPCPPPVNAADDPRSGNQNYLDAAPVGIDARYAWSMVDGRNTGFVDLEQGWTLNHEDLAAANITIISGVNQAFTGHGTAVLGEVVACDNTIGGIGIAPEAPTRVVSQWRSAILYSTAGAILSAADTMNPGDVLLLEAQTVIGSSSFLPVEVETAVFDAIRHAVDQGIVVVEAGGNGSNDLDAFRDSAGKAVLDRSSKDFKDSGAIMVGAASSAVPHQRLAFSNFGSRIDCYAWGQNIDTCGDGWQGNLTNSYTTGFGGTSGASPIITGAAILLQDWFRANVGHPLTSEGIRSTLSDETTGTASATPGTDRIGVMPDLEAIIELQQRIRRFRGVTKYSSFVQILIGIIDDSPGFIWVPGKGPVPVDPGWGRRLMTIDPAKRDLISALALNEISKGLSDSASRQALGSQSVKAMERALKEISKETAMR